MLPLFKRSEDFDAGASEFHGSGGPMRVTTQYEPHPLIAAMVAASQEAGIPFNADHNGAELDGVGYTQLTVRDGRRETAATSFLAPVTGNEGLTVYTHANARRLRFSGRRCSGVEVAVDGDLRLIEAAAEVVVCAGTIESPKLLMLSGIGPAGELGRLGINSLADLPGVGANLHDHLLSPVIFSSPKPIPPTVPGLTQLHAHLFWRSRPGARRARHPAALLPHAALPRGGGGTAGGLHDPRRADPARQPRRDPPAFRRPGRPALDRPALPELRRRPRGAGRLGRALPRDRAAAGARRVDGGGALPRPQSPQHAASCATTSAGRPSPTTTRSGPAGWGRTSAVVDPELRVLGVEGLRVADASVMPFITTGNTNAPTMMIGEKVSDLLLAARR